MLGVFVLLLASFTFGQGTGLGTVRGVITDPSGSVVPNATVSVADTATGTIRESKSNTREPTSSSAWPRDVHSFLYLNPNIVQADTNGDFKFVGSQSYGASFSPGAEPRVTINTDPAAGRVIYNPAFGQLIASYDQEGVSARREIQLPV